MLKYDEWIHEEIQPSFLSGCSTEVCCDDYLVQPKGWISNALSLQSQEILNRPVFVLDILKSVWKFWKLLKILKRFWTLLKMLNRFWKFWKFWTDSEHYWKFWTDSEQILNIAENSEQILNRFWKLLKIRNITENTEQNLNNIFLLKSIYVTSFSLDFN
jgi:hypothetical protein